MDNFDEYWEKQDKIDRARAARTIRYLIRNYGSRCEIPQIPEDDGTGTGNLTSCCVCDAWRVIDNLASVHDIKIKRGKVI